MNQMMEGLLRIFCNHQANDWAEWLPVMQYIINSLTVKYNQESPIQTLDGTYTKSTSSGKEPKGTEPSGKTKNPGNCLRRGGTCNATRTRVLGQTHQL